MKLRVLELYSGIGGAHYAFKESGLEFTVVGAVDVNNLANEVYKRNFPQTPLLQRNIESLTVKEWESLSPDAVWMSPPCQPFTRNGLKKDCSDHRTTSFLHILNLLKQLIEKPLYIILENVKGFEDSTAREILIKTLLDCGYNFQEFLISPDQIGIPNSRLRYYLLAKLKPLHFDFQKKEIWCDIPSSIAKCHLIKQEPSCIQDYLELESVDYFTESFLSDKILARYFPVLDIVEPHHHRSCCFTKGYSHYTEGTGSVLKSNSAIKLNEIVSTADKGNEAQLQIVRSLQLRYFTPREVANLMKFPSCFTFPSQFTKRQQYRLLGNSINVYVASTLIEILVENPE